MKKFNSIIILLISMFVFTAEIVCADSIELTGDTTFSGDSFTVGLTVNGKPGDSDMKVGGIQANDFIFNDDSNLTLKKLPSNIETDIRAKVMVIVSVHEDNSWRGVRPVSWQGGSKN